ncbi:MAG: glycosyltransferase [Planctomycetaceae bacterium]|nr:glycosyltransferase [Planctomycetaceae bacterium]
MLTPKTYTDSRHSSNSANLNSNDEQPLNVAIVHTADQGGGAEASTLLLHQALKELGHNSRMFVAAKRGSDPDVHQIERTRPFPGALRVARWVEDWTGWQYWYQPWFHSLGQLIGNADVVHYHSLWYGRDGFADVAALPKLTAHYPSLMTLRDWWMFTGHCAHPALGCERWKAGCGQCPDLNLAPAIKVDGTKANLRRKQKALRDSSIRVTTVSNWLAGEVRQSPVFQHKEIHTVHNGIDERVFFPRNRTEMRAKWNLPQERFIVMVAGQSVEGTAGIAKGAGDYALEAMTLSDADVYLLAVGRSSEKVLAQWGRDGRAIPFQDHPTPLAELYAAADVVVVASLWETFGRVPAEAQMCGIPVAAFATGGIPEIVDDEQTGLVVERLNSQALAAAIRKLSAQPELRHELGKQAVTTARTRFSNLAIAQQYVTHYRAEIAARETGAGGRR